MGIDTVALHIILKSMRHITQKDKVLTLGRQGIHIQNIFNEICSSYGLVDKYQGEPYCEEFFIKALGFGEVHSMDKNSYEQASIIFDLNSPIPQTLMSKYDYIYDGGTIEHIFNILQVMENVIDMLNVGGIFCSITCNNNFSGHGFYQFSPEFFLRTMRPEYGMEILEIYIAENHTSPNVWINMDPKQYEKTNRLTDRIDTQKEVYILTIARKISNTRKRLLVDHPQQFSYEHTDWV